ncbi:MAG: hypothetical protein ACRED6_06395 [Stellaceae bacterium]
MKLRLFALCCGLVLLTGCGSAWVKPGASEQQLGEDQAECLNEAERPGGPVFVNPLLGFYREGHTDSRVYDACMRDLGWSSSDG